MVELFGLLEIRSEFRGGKPSTEPSVDSTNTATNTNKELEHKAQVDKTMEDYSEHSCSKEFVNKSGSSSESTSVVCNPAIVKTEVEVDVGSEEEPISDNRRRTSSSSLIPVNLSLSNPENKDYSNLNSPVSDRDSRVCI